ncbi:MAG TPA: tetratricopeptide repeat protein [Lacunisphaera sp.]
MSDSGKAVFLSYASQDAEAAKRMADALRAAGVEVWFDAEGGLEHGDEWDAKIRRQIKECVLFLPIISANTQAREEGYFRIEWDLAAERARGIASGVAFILPVVIDGTKESAALVPDRFRSVQWTKLPGGNVPADVLQRFLKLWSHRTGAIKHRNEQAASAGREEPAVAEVSTKLGRKIYGGLAVLLLALAAAAVVWFARRQPAPTPAVAAVPMTEARELTRRARALIDDDRLAGRENYRLAEELGRRATMLDPTDGEAWGTLARALVEIVARNYDSTPARREQTRGAVERANRLAPLSVESGLALGGYQALGGLPAEAEKTARATLARFPDDHRCLLQLAEICHDTGRTAEALELLKRAAALPGGVVDSLSMESGLLRDQRRFIEAEAAADRSLAGAASYRGYQLKLLLTAFDLDDLERAQPVVEQLPARLQQEDLFAGLAAKYWLWRGQPNRSLEILRRVPRDFFEEQRQYLPKGWLTGWAQQQAGRSLAAKVEWEQALAVVENRLVAEPSRPQLLSYRARLLAVLGRRAEAEAALRLAEELGGGSGDFVPAVRVCLGDYEEAIQSLLAAFADRSQLRDRGVGNSIKNDPMWAPIRGDPRIKQLLAEHEEQLRRLKAGGLPPVAGAKGGDLATGGGPATNDKSVAVLAFANLSDDKNNEYFSDGISEELLNVLAKVPGLKVSARTSAFYFKGKEVPVPEIAKQLGVAYVVEGSVRKAGDKVRITAQLIKAVDGFHVWSDTFTRDLKDVFAVQDEIAGLIAQSLSLKLGARPGVAAPVNPRVIELYIQARQIWSARSMEDFARAEQLLNQALELDPGFGRARAALIDVRQMRAFRQSTIGSFAQRNSPELEGYLAQVREVLSIDPNLAEAYATLGTSLQGKWQWSEAEQAYRRALALNPNYATAHHWLGMQLAIDGRVDDAIAELKLASDLDPFSSIILDNYGWLLNHAGRHREALALLDRAQALNPGLSQTVAMKASSLWALGRRDEARALARQIQYYDLDEQVRTLLAVDLAGEAWEILGRADPVHDVSRFQPLLALGRREEAFAALGELKSGVTFGDCMELLYRPLFDPVRDDPRFLDFMAQLGLGEAHRRIQAWRQANPPEKAGNGK